ncbi:MAG: tetratricopeptide repeat protein [Candidatus Marinimicrobia bacterium]|nr:tetratricopeptide repeat protein [Candidatus Neomarinimicrobiota bacterium]
MIRPHQLIKTLPVLLLGVVALLSGQISDPYAEAARFFEMGRYQRATQRLEQVLLRDPRCVECYDLLARIASAQKQDSLAVEWYRAALRVEPDNAGLYQKLGLAEHRAGLLDSAQVDLERSLELNPTDSEVYFALGNVWFDQDSLALARRDFSRAIALDSTVANYHFQLASVFHRSDQPDSALREFKAAYRWYPKYTQAYELAATILISAGRWEEVVEVLDRGLASASETRNTRYWLGGALVEIGRYERAAEVLGGYVVRNQEHVGARYRYGLALFEIGEYETATEHLREVVKMRPDLTKAQLYLGRALSFMQQDSLAFVVFDSLLMQEPEHYEAWIERGDIDLRQGRYRDARTSYLRANAIEPRRWEAYHRQALARFYQQDYYSAELMLFKALNKADSVAVIYELLGAVAAAANEDDFAVYYFSRVLLLEPQPGDVRRQLIDALIRLRLWRVAERELLWFLEQDPENESVLYQLGLVAQAGGDIRSAADYFHRFQLIHQPRRTRERLELRVASDNRNPRHYKQLGFFHRASGNNARARDYFRQAVFLGDTTLSASDYLVEGEEP